MLGKVRTFTDVEGRDAPSMATGTVTWPDSVASLARCWGSRHSATTSRKGDESWNGSPGCGGPIPDAGN